jgi:uncharacterized membrane protein YbhN (UPF0104 family)
MRKLNAALLLLGVAFLVYLLVKVGPANLWRELTFLGWGLLPLILAEGLGNLAHTLGWRRCLHHSHRNVPLGRLFGMAMAGYALNYLTPSASIAGEVSKASLLTSNQNGPQAASSVLADKLTMSFAHLLLVALGSLVLLWGVKLPTELWAGLAVASVFVIGGMVAFLLIQKHGKLGALVRWLVARQLGGKALKETARTISQVDTALAEFYRERPRDLGLSVLWHFLGHSMAIVQTWLFLYLLHQHVSFVGAACAAFLGLWFDLLTFAVPLNLGALEGGRVLALKAVGCDAVLGVAFGLAVRVSQLFWAGVGLANYGLLLSQAAPRARKPEAVPPCPKCEVSR